MGIITDNGLWVKGNSQYFFSYCNTGWCWCLIFPCIYPNFLIKSPSNVIVFNLNSTKQQHIYHYGNYNIYYHHDRVLVSYKDTVE